MTPCSVPGCGQPAWARGWCTRHYRRWQRTGAEPTPERQVGEPDGYGRYGIMERAEDGALCHECGGWYVSVGAHAGPAHGMTAAQYRQAHGLARTQPLISLARSREISEQAAARVGSPAWQRLEAVRDPQAAADARTPEVFRTPATSAARAQRATDGRMDLSVEARERTCPVCGRSYTGRDRTCSEVCAREASRRAAIAEGEQLLRLDAEQMAALRRTTGDARRQMVEGLQRAGYTSRSIGQAIGLGPQAMSRDYPRPQD